MSIKIATESPSMSSASSSSSSISIHTVSTLRHQFDSNSGNFLLNNNSNNINSNKPYGSNVNRLRSVFVPQQQQQQQPQQLKKQKLNNDEESDQDSSQHFHQHQSRPTSGEQQNSSSTATTTTTSNSMNNNNNSRSRSLSTPRITTKQIIIKSSEDYDTKMSPSTTDSTLQANTNINNIIDSLKNNNDHLTRFQSAKALFARIEEEAKQAKQFIVPSTTTTPSSISLNQNYINSSSRRSLNFNGIHSSKNGGLSSTGSNNHRLSTSNHVFTSLPTTTTTVQISPPLAAPLVKTPATSIGQNSVKRKKENENKENLKVNVDKQDEQQQQQQQNTQTVNYRFNNHGTSNNENEETTATSLQSPQRRSWTKLQPQSPSRNSLPTSPNSSSLSSSKSSSSSNSPSQHKQQQSSIDEILNQISSSKLLTNNSNASTPIVSPSTVPTSISNTNTNTPTPPYKNNDFLITNTTPYTIDSTRSSSSPDSHIATKQQDLNENNKKSPVTPPSTPVLTNSLKINVLDTNENNFNVSEAALGRRQLFKNHHNVDESNDEFGNKT